MEAFSRSLPALSLNWVMRLSQPMRATQLKTQASSACSGTWLWLKTMLLFRVDAAGDEGGGDLARVRLQRDRVLRHRDRMQVDDAIHAVEVLLQLDEFDDRAEIVAEMQIAGGLHAREDALREGGHVVGQGFGFGRSYGEKRAQAQVPRILTYAMSLPRILQPNGDKRRRFCLKTCRGIRTFH